MSCGARPCGHRSCEAHAKSGSSPRRILLIRMPKCIFPASGTITITYRTFEVQQLTFIPFLFLTLSKLRIFLQSYLLIHWQMVRNLWNTRSLPCTSWYAQNTEAAGWGNSPNFTVWRMKKVVQILKTSSNQKHAKMTAHERVSRGWIRIISGHRP